MLFLRQHRTIPALRLKHRFGSCRTSLAVSALRIMLCCLVICAVFFDVYANSIDPVNASLYDSFVKKMRKASAKGRCAAPWQQAHRIIHL